MPHRDPVPRLVRAMVCALALVLPACQDMATDLGGDALRPNTEAGATPPVVSLSITPDEMGLGQSATLRWTATGASSCQASLLPATGGGTWGGSQPTSNTAGVLVTPTAANTYWYSLSCSGAGGSASASARLVVDPPLNVAPVSRPTVSCSDMTCSFDGRASSDDKAVVRYVWWDNFVTTPLNTTALFTRNFTTAHPRNWRLTVWDAEGLSHTDSVQFTLPAPLTPGVPTVSLTVAPGVITLGQSATLQWSSSNASSCTASVSPTSGGGAWSGSKPSSNTTGVSVTPTVPASYAYTLTCTGTGGSASASDSLVVNPPLAPTASLTANPLTAAVGSTVVLSWTSSNATSCTASGAWSGSKALNGSQSVVLATAGANTFTLSCAGLQQTAVASVSVTGTVAGTLFTAQFTPNAVTIPASEGAPYVDADFWTGQRDPLSVYGYGPTKVIRLYICLSAKVSRIDCSLTPPPTGPLSESMLNGISSRIAAYRNSGVRLLVRFVYNFGPIGPGARDVPASLIVTHLDQLAPILLQNRDMIMALQAGFIGVWGEWHNSTSGNGTPAAQKLVLDREAFHFRGSFPILLRYPADLLTYLNSQTPSPDFGLSDDYYASDASDGGTWSPRNGWSESVLKSYSAAVGANSMFVGEFGALDPTLQSCSALDSYSYSYRPQSLALTIWPASVGSLLSSQGCALSFFNKVGTRIEVRSVTLSGNATPGGVLHVSLTLANAGYGRVIRARPVTVVLRANGSVLQQTPIPLAQLDLRTLASSQQPVARVFAFDVTLPSSLPSQPVSLSLLLPDPAPSLATDPAHALPLNSIDQTGQPVFDPATGYNRLATIFGGVITAAVARTAAPVFLAQR
jgi:hypothetical protein